MRNWGGKHWNKKKQIVGQRKPMNSQVIHEISPEVPVVCRGTDLWKRIVLRWEWKSSGVIDEESDDDETGKLTWS